MSKVGEPYYRKDLALVHHLGFGFHADDCAPGIHELQASGRSSPSTACERRSTTHSVAASSS
jgi:hypothetical protein